MLAREPDGRVVFVHGGLPGEEVSVEFTKQKKDFAEAVLVDVSDPSAERRRPPCEAVARGCGGCGWQHASVELQEQMRVTIVREALTRLGGIQDPEVVVAGTSGPRTTVRMAFSDSGVGFREQRSNTVVPVETCLVAHPRINEMIRQGSFESAKEITLRVGANTGEALVVCSPRASGTVVPDAYVIGTDVLKQGKRAWFHEEVAGRRWRISARSFFQSSPSTAELLVGLVREAVESSAESQSVLDLYGGVGLFSGTLGSGRDVTLVEWNKSSVADARVNLSELKSCDIVRSDVNGYRASKTDVVVADPPRTGMRSSGIQVVRAADPATVVLVSCDAGPLGRDARLLVEAGYRFERAALINAFPHTPHVEVVSIFRREAASTQA
jgi:23S rRNA (uracil1939-C5)-methyltransferase